MIDGLSVVWSNPVLRVIAGCTVARGATHGIIATLIMLFAIRELGIQPGVSWMIFATGGVSSFSRALVAAKITRRLRIGPAMILGFQVGSVSPLFIALSLGSLVLAAAFLVAEQVVGGLPTTVYIINEVSLRRAISLERAVGRVNASMRFVELATTFAVSLAAGAAAELIGMRWTLAASAFSLMLGGLWLVLSPIRLIRETPSPSIENSTVVE